MLKAIETIYKGYRFRSRLEARWAVFFDTLGIPWEYEPEGFVLPNGVRYLPDFRLYPEWEFPIWFEVKGKLPTIEELEKLQALADSTGCHAMLASGTMDVPTVHWSKDGTFVVEGARIVAAVPTRAVKKADFTNEDCPEKISYVKQMNSLCLHGFYVNADGLLEIDNLYAEDLEFTPDVRPRPARALLADATWVHVLNMGTGRSFRGERLRQAYAAARAARFEFGETPR